MNETHRPHSFGHLTDTHVRICFPIPEDKEQSLHLEWNLEAVRQ